MSKNNKRYRSRDQNKVGVTFSCNSVNYDFIYNSTEEEKYGTHSRSIFIDALVDYAIHELLAKNKAAINHIKKIVDPKKYTVNESEGHL